MNVREIETICGFRQSQINEAVACGDYDWAPATTAGRGRRWDESDAIALLAVTILVEAGLTRRRAFQLGGRLRRALQRSPYERDWTDDWFVFGSLTLNVDALRAHIQEERSSPT